ncbi:MAG TPA: P27 family phage terminase small subunit [Rubrivivax sp.]|nr:P27 family phage terminase small subunit [Rubrivivax sp.]
MTTKRPSTPSAPADLSAEAKRLWQRTLTEYTFNTAADFALLAELCRATDRLRDVQASISATGLTVEGAAGQLRPNPLLAIEDSLRKTILAHVRALRLTGAAEY